MTRGTPLRLLVVSPSHDVFEPTTGTGARLHELASRLADRHRVSVLCPAEFAAEPPDWVDAAYGFDRFGPGYLTDLNPLFLRAVRRALDSEPFDVLHVALPKGVVASKLAVRAGGHEAAVVYAAQNVEAEHARDVDDPTLPVYKRLVGSRLIPRIERVSLAAADYVTTVSERDRETFVRRFGVDPDRILAVPTGTTVPEPATLADPAERRRELGLDDRPTLVFHGSYSHPPNREAVSALVERVVPGLRDRGVDVQLLLVGDGMPAVDDSAVTTAGFVEDLYGTLAAADAAVVPIRHGGGTKTKVFDYLGVGLPIVTTEKGAEGIELVDGEHALVVADVDESFVDAVAQVVTDDELGRRLSEASRTLARERYAWGRSVDRLAGFYEGLVWRDRTDPEERERARTVG
ncbi:glycosyltransferase family 4 protein [Haloarchaeobius litoreus]|uniref:Glycosyltransferase family 4 protein n=1 Tax=Haloarchaeobius litoreus TaxID=755306 RepID=A0ABD6DNW8_9EURY